MATNAGQGNSTSPGVEQVNATEGKATNKPKPPVRLSLPPGPRTPYDFYDAWSPPAIPKRPSNASGNGNGHAYNYRQRAPLVLEPKNRDTGIPSASSLTPSLKIYHEACVKNVIKGATEDLESLSTQTPRITVFKMASPQLIFVDGTFADLAQEMADYLQVGEEVKGHLSQEKNEEALQVLVQASQSLNGVTEKEFTGAYNLLIHLVLQSNDPKKYLPTVCGNLQRPITSSPTHGFTLAANALSTIFNLLPQSNPLRFNVLLQITRFIRQHGQFELLKPRLHNLEGWFKIWETDEDDQRRLYVEVSDAAAEAGYEE